MKVQNLKRYLIAIKVEKTQFVIFIVTTSKFGKSITVYRVERVLGGSILGNPRGFPVPAGTGQGRG